MSGASSASTVLRTHASLRAFASAPPTPPAQSLSLSLSVVPSPLQRRVAEPADVPATPSSGSDHAHRADSPLSGDRSPSLRPSRASTPVLACDRDELCAPTASNTSLVLRSHSSAFSIPPHSLPPSRTQSNVDASTVSLHADDIASLIPSSVAPISTVLASATLPECLREALHTVHPSARASAAGSKQRLALAVALAVHAHTGRTTVLAKPKAVLQESMSTVVEPAGRGIAQGPATALSLALGFGESLPMLLQPTNFERVDSACRILLHALFLSPFSAAVALGALYDACRPSSADAGVLPSYMQLRSAAAVRRFSPIPMVAAVPFPSLSASLLRRDFSLSPLLGASPTPTASINARRLSGVCVVPTDGANAQCFYIAIANALTIASETALDSRELRWPELHNRIRTALASINSAPLLASYSFDLDPTAGAEEVERAKANYLSSADFTRQQWGGSREMYLLSHFHSGQLAFRTFNSVAQATGDQPWRFLCAPPPSAVANVAVSATRPPRRCASPSARSRCITAPTAGEIIPTTLSSSPTRSVTELL